VARQKRGGDSFFFGYGLDQERTLSHQLTARDPRHRYLNLAFPGDNLLDALARYDSVKDRIGKPVAVIQQVLMGNDIYGSNGLMDFVYRTVEADRGTLPFPFDRLWDRTRALTTLTGFLEQQVREDPGDRRWQTYLEQPLTRLWRDQQAHQVPLIIVDYTGDDADFTDYRRRLQVFCRQRQIHYLDTWRLLDQKTMDDRLPDGHPTAQLNRKLAGRLLKELGPLLAGR
jgi:hypothetical protein